MHDKPDSLAYRRGGPVCEDHEPGTRGARREGNGCDAGAEGEAFEGLVEGDGDKEDDERRARGDADSHADEDGVEEDAGFEEEALEDLALLFFFWGENDGWEWGARGGSEAVAAFVGKGLSGGIEFIEFGIGAILGVLILQFVILDRAIRH